MRTLKRLLISSLALMVLVGCGADTSSPITACSVSPTPECFAGSYVLVSVNGQALPAFTIPGQEQWTASTLNVKANGTMSGTITWKEYRNGSVVDSGMDSFSGTYSVSGLSIRIQVEDDPPGTATVSSDGSVTLINDGLALKYQRK